MKRLSVLSIISFIIILIVIVLFVLNRYYEINSDIISIPIICCCLIFTVIILAIVQMVKSGKKRLSKAATIGLVLIAPFVYRIGHDLLGSWKTYEIYSKDGYMIIARINESEYGNRCNIFISKGSILKKIGPPIGLQGNYDPIETNNYEIIDDGQNITVTIKCSKETDSYDNVNIIYDKKR